MKLETEFLYPERIKINMKKILVKVNSLDDLKYPAHGFILGVLDYSFLYEKAFSLSEIENIKNQSKNKEIYVELSAIIKNNKVDDYKTILKKLDSMNLNGIIVSDIAALTYNLNTPIILNQLHLNNSSLTINHYYNNRVNGIILTNDITLDEINYIRNNTKSILYKEVFTYPHLSTSLRRLVSNYKEYFNIDDNNNSYYISEDDKDYYSIVEDNYGTHILGSKVLNLFDMVDDINVDYIILNSYMLNKENFKEVVNIFINNDKNKASIIKDLFDTSEGFINKKTIYKVKNNE